jgi:hypothetical protein
MPGYPENNKSKGIEQFFQEVCQLRCKNIAILLTAQLFAA